MFPAVPPSDSVGSEETRVDRRLRPCGDGGDHDGVDRGLCGCLGGVVVAGTREMAQYLRLGALDDYRGGYQMGSEWTRRGASDCQEVMTTRYGDPWEGHGWNAFVVGCRDAVGGRDAATWYSLRGRLGETTASD